MKTIFNVFVPMESQEQIFRLESLCLDNDLPIWECSAGWQFFDSGNFFAYEQECKEFFCMSDKTEINKWNYSEVTEAEFLELLKLHKSEGVFEKFGIT